MRKHVTPAHPDALIPDPVLGDRLPPEGREVVWSAYWAGLEMRKDITVAAPKASAASPEAPAEPEIGADPSA